MLEGSALAWFHLGELLVGLGVLSWLLTFKLGVGDDARLHNRDDLFASSVSASHFLHYEIIERSISY